MAVYGRIWPCVAVHGRIWQYMAVYGRYMAVYGRIWPYMIVYGHVWPYMAVCCSTWPYVVVYCKSWAYMVVYGRLGSFGSHQVVGVEAYSSVFLIASWVPKWVLPHHLVALNNYAVSPKASKQRLQGNPARRGQTAAASGSRPQRIINGFTHKTKDCKAKQRNTKRISTKRSNTNQLHTTVSQNSGFIEGFRRNQCYLITHARTQNNLSN